LNIRHACLWYLYHFRGQHEPLHKQEAATIDD
jgi:hypothetical protein